MKWPTLTFPKCGGQTVKVQIIAANQAREARPSAEAEIVVS